MPNIQVASTPPTPNEIWDSWLGPAKPKPKPITFNEDPVAIACASWRLWKQGGPRWLDLDGARAQEQDHERAGLLRSYYGGKLTFDALKGEGGLRTSFRQKLYAIVSNCHEYTEDDIGLLHRLPYLYEEDLCLDELTESFVSADTKHYGGPTEVKGWLSLHSQMLRSRKTGEWYYYWLRRDGSDNLYHVRMKSDDQMRPLVESLLAESRKYTAVAYAKPLQGRPEFVYYMLGSVRIA